MTKEELEKQKLKVEIEQIRKPFWKNPTLIISFLTVIISATIGFSSYFTKVNQDNITKIEELQELTKKQEILERKIELQNLNLQKTQIENRAKQLQTNLDKINADLLKLESYAKPTIFFTESFTLFNLDLKPPSISLSMI